MGSTQEEIRRLMKEAKQKPNAAVKGSSSATSKAPAMPNSTTSSQAPKPAIPAGFFDDSLADAKARNVDVEQLAAKQLESEWEAFQEFAEEVEQQTVKEEQEQAEENKEREAVEQLENMQYVDRYRVALERATSLRNGEKKRKLQESDDKLEEEDGASAVEMAVNEYKKQHKRHQKQQLSDSEDDFDPCNWRSRGI